MGWWQTFGHSCCIWQWRLSPIFSMGNKRETCRRIAQDLTNFTLEKSTESCMMEDFLLTNPFVKHSRKLYFNLGHMGNRNPQGYYDKGKIDLSLWNWACPMGGDEIKPHPIKEKNLWLGSDHLRHQLWWYSDHRITAERNVYRWWDGARLTYRISPQQVFFVYSRLVFYDPAWKGDIFDRVLWQKMHINRVDMDGATAGGEMECHVLVRRSSRNKREW